MEKGEIALNEQYLLFPLFSKDLYCRHKKPGLVWERVNIITKWFSVINSYPVHNIFHSTELKVFADEIVNVALNPFPHNNFGPDQTENICKPQIKCKKNVALSPFPHYNFGPDQIENICKPQLKCKKSVNFCLCTSNYPQCFQKASLPDPSKGVIVWEWVKV